MQLNLFETDIMKGMQYVVLAIPEKDERDRIRNKYLNKGYRVNTFFGCLIVTN